MKTNDPLHYLKFKRGEDLPQSKLTESDVIIIRELIEYREKIKQDAKSLSDKNIAEKFGVHRRTIERINSGEIWKHV